ncbi:FAD-dependent oxidoreductase [Streptomyces apocyni]|uniref:FAD-dependent oxidoreductase n=1 Tax=Streptomyces apocyni TaxID=2654677 RepID=UPI0012EA7508|nr:FAD-dependent monooxygenase [Streptomyces apocyni]
MSRSPSLPTGHSGRPRRAVVVGGGLAGMLTAAVLARATDAVDEVMVIERDTLPEGPHARKSLPQARHTHLLWSGGARAFESLLPGITDRWLAAGARRIPLPTGLVTMTAQGWMRRWSEMQYVIACSRDLLDWVVREQVLPLPSVTVLERTDFLGLVGDADRVTGARVRTAEDGEQVLHADLVIDASGRGSQAPAWLEALGVGPIEEAEVDSGLVYASRVYRAPEGTEDFPIVNVQADPRVPVPGRTATIVPVEGARWLVTLSGTRGGEPTRDPARFEPFARSVRHPVVGELISQTTPLTEEVTLSRSTVNRRRYFEKARDWPEGFIAVGDAVATYNPVYGQGMSVAAQGITALRDQLASGPSAHDRLRAPGLARQVQRAIGRRAAFAWELATSQDILYPGAKGKRPPAAAKLLNRYVDRFMETATDRAAVAQALFDVLTMSAPPTAWVQPDIAVAMLRGRGKPALQGPPLTVDELKAAASGPRLAD